MHIGGWTRAFTLATAATFLAQTVSWYLVQPYVRGITTSPLDEWPGALQPAQLSISPH